MVTKVVNYQVQIVVLVKKNLFIGQCNKKSKSLEDVFYYAAISGKNHV